MRRQFPTQTIALIVIVLAASILRLGGIASESLWHDEVLTAYSAQVPLTRVIASVRSHETAPPGYLILMNVWSKIAGLSDLALRLPSALIGIATVILLWRMGAELFDSTIALTAAATLAVSPIHIAYSQEARGYALLVLLLLLCIWSFARRLRKGSTSAQIAYVVIATFALYTHTYAIFTLAALNLFFFWRLLRKFPTGVGVRRWILLQLAIILLFGPWIAPTLEVARMGLPWLVKSTPFHDAMMSYAGGRIAATVMGIFCALALYRGWRRRDDRVLLLLLLAIVPVLGPIIYGVFTSRYGIAALIGLTFLTAYGAASLGRWACVIVIVLATLNWFATSTLGHARYPNYTHKSDVRSAAAYVLDHAHPGDAVNIAISRPIWHVFDHYTRGHPFPHVEEPAWDTPRIWLLAPDATTANAAAERSHHSIASRHSYDGVELLELQAEPHNPPAVPTSSPLQ